MMNSIVEAVIANGKTFADKHAIVFNDKKISYSTLSEKIMSFAATLKLREIKKGSRIAIEADDLISFFAAFLGCQLAGCICVPIERNVSIYKLQEILRATKPTLIFMKNNGEEFEPFFQTPAPEKMRLPKANIASAIISTTGTTGSPVMVTHTNKSLLATNQNLAQGTNITSDTVLFSNMPFDLAAGFRRVFATLCEGGTCVLTNQPLTEALLLDCFENYHITFVSLIYVSINMLLGIRDEKLKEKMRTVNGVESASGPLSPFNMRAFHKLYPNVILYNVYGTTESGCILIHNTQDNTLENCLGKPTCNSEIFLIDENGHRVEQPGEYGYIAVKGDMNMQGYYRKKALTEEVMSNDYIVINDIAYFDKDGYYYFVSRVGDIIDFDGHKIIPTEVEAVISEFDRIKDCAYSAEENDYHEKIPTLYVVCDDEDANFEQLTTFMKKHLEHYKIPQKIIRVEQIPRTVTGKIMRKSLSISKGN